MGSKSFYDLDYIIELNEQRLEQYANALQKNTEKFTTLLVLYSAFCIFLVPVCQKLFIERVVRDVGFYWAFYGFAVFFGVSLVFAVLQMLPERLRMLPDPKIYYKLIKNIYELAGLSQEEIDIQLKASYISELEKNIDKRRIKLLRKTTFYNLAFYFAIISCIPYLYCIWKNIYLEKKNELLTNSNISLVILSKTNHHMWRRKTKHKEIDEHTLENLIFKLPGVDVSKTIPSGSLIGRLYPWGFVPDRHQPKSIPEILYEQLMEKKRKSQNNN
ncbi:hypothetical protein SAMN05428949_1917 [Chitinophaga sp. YR627]|uniref:hypothetical protein n=1 Tax=Chitinophaga sp. YR627 TaxID=1881041 RepID=UPI0008EC6554|nr:hypothetical protein [Chitinophaga sp. YR627]SFN20656.1 hypothetical protein SAMN05428949_1917 [Chitinophaga sp. YR627]